MNKLKGLMSWESGRRHTIARTTAMLAALVILAAYVATHQFAAVGHVELTATMGKFSPSLVKVGTSSTSVLTAGEPYNYNPSVPAPQEAFLVKTFTWSVVSVKKAKTRGGPYTSAKLGIDYRINRLPPTHSLVTLLTFKPKIARYWKVSVNCGVMVKDTKTGQKWSGSASAGPEDLTSYTLDITYTGPVVGGAPDSGATVTGKTTKVHAGWPIQLGAALAPTDLASKFTWTIAGAGGNGSEAIGGYDVVYTSGSSTTSATVTTLVPGNTTAPSFGPYYYTAGAANGTALSEDVSVAPQGVNIPAAKATFSITSPTAALTTTTSVVCGGTDTSLGAGAMDLGDYFMTNLDPTSPNPNTTIGISFDAQPGPNAGFAGQFNYGQVYRPNETWINANYVVLQSLTGVGLDTEWPYDNRAGTGANVMATTNDNPGIGVAQVPGSSQVSVSNSATMWLMYKPTVPGSIWIPVDWVTWNWAGVDYQDGSKPTGWDIKNTSQSNNPAGSPTNKFPEWTGLSQ